MRKTDALLGSYLWDLLNQHSGGSAVMVGLRSSFNLVELQAFGIAGVSDDQWDDLLDACKSSELEVQPTTSVWAGSAPVFGDFRYVLVRWKVPRRVYREMLGERNAEQ